MYPVGEASASGWLDVGDGNRVYWEEAGNREGVPALILHGGPGSGFSPSMRRFFDPEVYRIIGFDQRGCGLSTPHASGEGVDFSVNTTAHLIGDIERLRAHFGVAKWVFYGMSWGVTLGLAYAQAHPDRVAAMVCAGVTSTRRREIDWMYRDVAPLFPEEFERFRAGVPPETHPDRIVEAYNDLMFDADQEVRAKAARDFHDWDNVTVSVNRQAGRASDGADPARLLARGRIVTHYFRHTGWLEDSQLLRGAGALKGIPGVLVQGRVDLQGPLLTAWELAKAWPGSELVVIDGAGHSSSDAGIGAAIVAALDRFAR